MSRFTCLTNLELFLVQETFVEQLELVSQICATVTSPFIETLDICLRWGKENNSIPEVFASLEKLRAIDTVLSRTQFSHLSKVTFDFLSYIELEKQPTTFGCLVGPSPNRVPAQSSNPAVRPGLDELIPSDAYFLHEWGTTRLSNAFLEDLLRRKTELELRDLHNRGICQTKMTVGMSHKTDGILPPSVWAKLRELRESLSDPSFGPDAVVVVSVALDPHHYPHYSCSTSL